MKKLFLSTLLSLTLIGGASVSLASNANYNISTEPPTISTNIGINTEHDGTSKWVIYPDSTWDISTKGEYEINGFGDHSDLYTNYLLTGKTSYTIVIKNDMTQTDMKYKVYKKIDNFFDKRLKTVSISYQDEKTTTISGLNEKDEIYILFFAPADFHGSIK